MACNFNIIVLQIDDGKVAPLAWAPRRLSLRELRRACRRFHHDPDVVRPISMHWTRLYQRPADMMRELPRYI